jgi:hypothetical protein
MDSSNNYVYVLTKGTFRIVKVWPPIMPYTVKNITYTYPTADMKTDSGKAYLPWIAGDMDIYTIEPPELAAYAGQFLTTGVEGSCAEGSGNYAYEGTYNPSGPSDMYIADVTDPAAAVQVGVVSFPDRIRHIDVVNGYAFVCSDYFYVTDVDPPASAHTVKSVTDYYKPEDIYIQNGYAYMITNKKMVIIDVDPPESSFVKESVDLPLQSSDICVSRGYAYITMNDAGNTHGILGIMRL